MNFFSVEEKFEGDLYSTYVVNVFLAASQSGQVNMNIILFIFILIMAGNFSDSSVISSRVH